MEFFSDFVHYIGMLVGWTFRKIQTKFLFCHFPDSKIFEAFGCKTSVKITIETLFWRNWAFVSVIWCIFAQCFFACSERNYCIATAPFLIEINSVRFCKLIETHCLVAIIVDLLTDRLLAASQRKNPKNTSGIYYFSRRGQLTNDQSFLSSSLIGFQWVFSRSQVTIQNTNLFRISTAGEKIYPNDMKSIVSYFFEWWSKLCRKTIEWTLQCQSATTDTRNTLLCSASSNKSSNTSKILTCTSNLSSSSRLSPDSTQYQLFGMIVHLNAAMILLVILKK